MFHYVVIFGEWIKHIGIENKEATNRFSKYMKSNLEAYSIQSVSFMGLFIIGLSFFLTVIHIGNYILFNSEVSIGNDLLIHPVKTPITTFILDGFMILFGFTLVMGRGIIGKVIARKKIMKQNIRKLTGSDGS